MAIHKITPSSKDYLWGGTKLIEHYGKTTDQDIMAESWEISSHPDGPSYLENGQTLIDYVSQDKERILGKNGLRFEDFPILIKFIDAKDVLSIQVHPDDAYALKHENQYGKEEMWYILEAEEGSSIYYGVNQDISKEDFAKAIEENEILDVLNRVEVKPGDVIYVEAGTIHAIGKGIVLCEIQQNSNVTYRVYDFNRKDKDGNTRDLHIEESIEVSTLTKQEVDFTAQGNLNEFDEYSRQVLVDSKYFVTENFTVDGNVDFEVDESSFVALICLEGEIEVTSDSTTLNMTKGESIFVDANSGNVNVKGKGNFLHVSV
ncbi:MAG TPA: type I phosphomannose isomerase catalytic subunit [Erysipelothrix sp.]|nr:type I phosphomannose isomerase catalytic subunit [Erysipelothrix sp.]